MEAELFYVRDGIINNYALNFIVPIPSKLNLIHFTWESLANRPVSTIANYTSKKNYSIIYTNIFSIHFTTENYF